MRPTDSGEERERKEKQRAKRRRRERNVLNGGACRRKWHLATLPMALTKISFIFCQILFGDE